MTDEPDIIKQLREAEKLGLFQNKAQSKFEELESVEESSDDVVDEVVVFDENELNGDETQDLYRTIFENVNDEIIYVDKYGKVLDVNRRCYDIFGYKPEEMIGKNFTKLGWFGLKDLPKILKIYKNAVSGKTIDIMELEVKHKDGHLIPVEVSTAPVKNNGKNVGFVSIVRDNSERKKADEELKKSNMELDAIVNNSYDLMTILDFKDNKILWSNNRWNEVLGWSPEIVKNPIELCHPEDRGKIVKAFEDLVVGKVKEVKNIECGYKSKEGKYKFFMCNISKIKMGNNDVLFTDAHEITELKESEEKYRNLVSNVQGTIYIGNEDWTITFLNPNFEDIVGYPSSDFINNKVRSFTSVVHPDDIKYVENEISRAYKERQTNIIMEYRVIHKDGDIKWVSDRVKLILDEDNKMKGYEGLVTDITEKKKTEEKIKENNVLLSGILENTHMMAVFLDVEFNFIFVNKAYAKTCNYPQSFFTGKNHFDLYPGEEMEAIFQGVVDSGKPIFIEARPFVFPDQPERGTTYWDWSLMPIKDSKNTVTGLVFTLADVTARTKVELELNKSHDDLEKRVIERTSKLQKEISTRKKVENDLIFKDDVIKSASSVIAASDLKGKMNYVNPVFLKTWGFDSYEEIKGKSFSDFWLVADIYDEVMDSLKKKGKWFGQIKAKKKDGSLFDVEVQASTVFDNSGKPIGLMSSSVDITERKKMEEDLNLKNIVFNSSIAANSIADKNGNLIHVNPAFLDLWRYSSEDEALGISVASFFKKQEDAGPVIESLNKTGKWDGEFQAKRKDGSTFISRGYASVIHNVKGEMIGYQSSNIDITIEKQVLNNLKKGKDVMEEKYKILFDSSTDAIMTLAPPDWKFTSGNNATVKLFHAKDEKEFTSKDPGVLSPKIQPNGNFSADEAKKMIMGAMETGSNFFEWTHQTIDGKEFHATVLLTKVEIEKGKPFLQATVRDITAEKKVEEELQDRLTELERWKKVTMGREIEMRNLKKKIKELDGE